MRYFEILFENIDTQKSLEILARNILNFALVGPYGNGAFEHGVDLDDVDVPKNISILKRPRKHTKLWIVFKPGAQESFYDDKRQKISLKCPYYFKDFFWSGFGSEPGKPLNDDQKKSLLVQHKSDIEYAFTQMVPELVHELTHALDDRRSKGKYVKNARSIHTKNMLNNLENDYSRENVQANNQAWSDAYSVDPAEVNAWFQSAVAASRDYLNASFEDYKREFSNHYMHYRILPKEEQKRLMKRLYAEWKSAN